MAETVQIRFRHTHGDLGPYTWNLESTSVLQLKEKLLAEWPREGELAKEPPTCANDIRFILSGKYVDATKQLKEYKKDMGEIKPDTVVTFLIIVRPTPAPASRPGQSGSTGTKEEAAKPACCTIS